MVIIVGVQAYVYELLACIFTDQHNVQCICYPDLEMLALSPAYCWSAKLSPLLVGHHFGRILLWFVVGSLRRQDSFSLKISLQVLIVTVAFGVCPVNSAAGLIYHH